MLRCRWLLTNKRQVCNVNTLGPEGSTPLVYWCKEGDLARVRTLLDLGANPLAIGEVDWSVHAFLFFLCPRPPSFSSALFPRFLELR